MNKSNVADFARKRFCPEHEDEEIPCGWCRFWRRCQLLAIYAFIITIMYSIAIAVAAGIILN